MATGWKLDAEKIRMDLIPPSTLRGLGEVLTFGAKKYGDRNWENGFDWSRIYGAAMRHLTAWWDGENTDPETGLSHLKHAMACVSFLIEFEEKKRGVDNRPGTRRNSPDSNDSSGGHPCAG